MNYEHVVFHYSIGVEEYAKHKRLAMAGRSEGMPNVLLEAMVRGCAYVCADCDFEPSEAIWDGENSFLVLVHDVQAITDKLYQLVEHDEDAKAMENGQKQQENVRC